MLVHTSCSVAISVIIFMLVPPVDLSVLFYICKPLFLWFLPAVLMIIINVIVMMMIGSMVVISFLPVSANDLIPFRWYLIASMCPDTSLQSNGLVPLHSYGGLLADMRPLLVMFAVNCLKLLPWYDFTLLGALTSVNDSSCQSNCGVCLLLAPSDTSGGCASLCQHSLPSLSDGVLSPNVLLCHMAPCIGSSVFMSYVHMQ